MVFLISLAEVLVILLLFNKSIKSHPVPFYLGALAISIFNILQVANEWGKDWPNWIRTFFVSPVNRGGISIALFVVVMWLGVLPKTNKTILNLYMIRGEISIMASIFAFSHNITYGFLGKQRFIKLFTDYAALGSKNIIATVISVLLLIIMIPLFITSFQNVRKKMDPAKWKKLQQWAYLFYVLLYAHLMVLFVPKMLAEDPEKASGAIQNVVIYSIVFIPYFVLLIRKLIKKKKKIE